INNQSYQTNAYSFASLTENIIPNRNTHRNQALIYLHSASKATLMTLPEITNADAANIIAGRPYRSSLQFKTRRIVSAETYARISGRVVAKKPAQTTQRPAPNEPTE